MRHLVLCGACAMAIGAGTDARATGPDIVQLAPVALGASGASGVAEDADASAGRLLLASFGLGPNTQHFLDQHPNALRSVTLPIVGALHFDPNDVFSRINFLTAPDFSGFICLDWEGVWLTTLEEGPEDPEFATAMQSGFDLLALVRALRPNARFGFYGIPFREYFSPNAEWIESVFDVLPLIQASDALFPSIYDFFECCEADDHVYVQINVGVALEVADGKPVFPYVWHRYHPNIAAPQEIAFQLIDDEAYAAHIAAALGVEIGGRRVAGICMWDASHSFAEAGVLPDAIPPGMPIDAYIDGMYAHYLCVAGQQVLGVDCEIPVPSESDCDGDGTPDYLELLYGLAIDCNGTNVPDACEIAANPALDLDGSGYLDACQPGADLNGDGSVDVVDLLMLLLDWGGCSGCPTDIDGSGTVGVEDLLVILDGWG